MPMQTQGKPPSIRVMENRISDLEAENERLREALNSLLKHGFAEDCQECAIGQSKAWKHAKSVIANQQQTKPEK